MSNKSKQEITTNNLPERLACLWGLTIGLAINVTVIAACLFAMTGSTNAAIIGCVVAGALTIPACLEICSIASVTEDMKGLGGLVGVFLACSLAGLFMPLLVSALLILWAISLLLQKQPPTLFSVRRYLIAG